MQDPKTATTAERNETTERYEAPRVESVVTADDGEREAVFGGGISMN